MNKTISAFLVLVLFACFTQSYAGLAKINQPSWDGTWQDKNGSVMSIRENNGFLNISGKDKASIYNCACLVAANGVAKCFGEGMNYVKDLRFLYQSTISMDGTGELSETWEAFFTEGTLSGKATFMKMQTNSR